MNISVCRSYESSYNFLNSRISYDEESELKLQIPDETPSELSIAACTQTAFFLQMSFPLWINYHYKMGIKHFYIYDHAPFNTTRLHQTLKSYIDYNIVTIIPWHVEQWDGFDRHSSSLEWISHQIWSQNDCIHRYGHRHSWMLISDVDEFVCPMGIFKNFQPMLDQVHANYSAVQLLQYGFKYLFNETRPTEEDRPSI